MQARTQHQSITEPSSHLVIRHSHPVRALSIDVHNIQPESPKLAVQSQQLPAPLVSLEGTGGAAPPPVQRLSMGACSFAQALFAAARPRCNSTAVEHNTHKGSDARQALKTG